MDPPSTYFTYTILPESCTCGKRLGIKQKEIEESINENVKIMTHREAKIKVINDFGLTKMCCREKIINTPRFYINNVNGNAKIDITTYDNGVLTNNYVEPGIKLCGYFWNPKTNGVPDFDEEKYAKQLHEMKFGNQITVSSTSTNFSRFPIILPTNPIEDRKVKIVPVKQDLTNFYSGIF